MKCHGIAPDQHVLNVMFGQKCQKLFEVGMGSHGRTFFHGGSAIARPDQASVPGSLIGGAVDLALSPPEIH